MLAEISIATLHVHAGEPDGAPLAARAIDGVAGLRSARARARLLPLADALDARPGSDAQELAHRARQVAAAPV